MRLSYNVLKQYVDLHDITPKMLADKITACGLEVEGLEEMAYATNLVVGYVEECVDHPNSDHLHICQVNVGTDVRQIVCGAPNVAKGQKVIVALPGCKLRGGDIKDGVVRGEESKGMICSLSELGVDPKQLTEQQLAGIEVLGDDAVVGDTNVLGYLSLDDTILDVGLTPNRNDCLAMWAMAKEVGAILNREVRLPDYHVEVEESKTDLVIKSETEKCPTFLGKVIDHVEIKESPKWIKDALKGAGIKAINNVVDISNLVMLETGQPLHFYDLAKIPAKEITVKQGLHEAYTALDGVEYNITEDDIMITTEGKAIGIAGIMGGDDSKIDEESKGIIIEAAIFDHVCIRNSARNFNLNTEAAQHFIKGVDPLACVKAVERSVQLLVEYASASGIEETVVCGSLKEASKEVSVTLSKVNSVLGTTFTMEEACDPLARLGFEPKVDGDVITCTIPSYRTDISIAEDLVEEVIRIQGFDHIVSTLPLMPTTQGNLAPNGRTTRMIKKMLNGFGYSEIISYSLVSKKHIDNSVMPLSGAVELANPASDERRYFRTSIMPSLLDTVAFNTARSNDNFGLFEVAVVYNEKGEPQDRLALALTPTTVRSKWQAITTNNDFYVMKGQIYALLEELGFDEKRVTIKVNDVDATTFHPSQSAALYLGKDLLGVFGKVHPAKAKEYDIDACMIGEFNLSVIFNAKASKVKFVPICKYPSSSYDLALLVDLDVKAGDIVNIVRKNAGKILKDVEVFDVYKGKGVPEGQQSIAVSMVFQSEERTLTDKDINPVVEKIVNALRNQLKAVLREA